MQISISQTQPACTHTAQQKKKKKNGARKLKNFAVVRDCISTTLSSRRTHIAFDVICMTQQQRGFIHTKKIHQNKQIKNGGRCRTVREYKALYIFRAELTGTGNIVIPLCGASAATAAAPLPQR